MSKYFVTLITGNAGIIVRWIAAVIVAGIVTLLAHMGFNLDGDSASKLAAGVALAVAGALGEIAAKINAAGVADIQAAFTKVTDEINTDGHAGQITVDAAKKIADEAAKWQSSISKK